MIEQTVWTIVVTVCVVISVFFFVAQTGDSLPNHANGNTIKFFFLLLWVTGVYQIKEDTVGHTKIARLIPDDVGKCILKIMSISLI